MPNIFHRLRRPPESKLPPASIPSEQIYMGESLRATKPDVCVFTLHIIPTLTACMIWRLRIQYPHHQLPASCLSSNHLAHHQDPPPTKFLSLPSSVTIFGAGRKVYPTKDPAGYLEPAPLSLDLTTGLEKPKPHTSYRTFLSLYICTHRK